MLHTGDRVTDFSERKGTIMGETRYRDMWFKIVSWDSNPEEPKECPTWTLRRIND